MLRCSSRLARATRRPRRSRPLWSSSRRLTPSSTRRISTAQRPSSRRDKTRPTSRPTSSAAAQAAAASAPPVVPEKTSVAATPKVAQAKPTAKKPEAKIETTVAKEVIETKPVEKPAEPAKKGKDGESFDDLLKEAGVADKKAAAPKLDKKSLTGDEFKAGMGALSGKAQACFKGTQGTAIVKLVVAPSGQVTKVSVGGAFAGKPEADCVTPAVKNPSFPAWDGGQQSIGYTYLLSE